MKDAMRVVVTVVVALTIGIGIITGLDTIRQASFKVSQEIQKTLTIR